MSSRFLDISTLALTVAIVVTLVLVLMAFLISCLFFYLSGTIASFQNDADAHNITQQFRPRRSFCPTLVFMVLRNRRDD